MGQNARRDSAAAGVRWNGDGGVSFTKENPSMNRRIEAERFFNFADALTAEVVQV